MGLLRSVIEIGFGLMFLVGAVFIAAYALRHGEEFFGSFERGAWLGPARRLVRDVVVPNAAVFTVALIDIEAAAPCLRLTRGPLVGPMLLAGGCFAFAAAFFPSPAGTVASLALATALGRRHGRRRQRRRRHSSARPV